LIGAARRRVFLGAERQGPMLAMPRRSTLPQALRLHGIGHPLARSAASAPIRGARAAERAPECRGLRSACGRSASIAPRANRLEQRRKASTQQREHGRAPGRASGVALAAEDETSEPAKQRPANTAPIHGDESPRGGRAALLAPASRAPIGRIAWARTRSARQRDPPAGRRAQHAGHWRQLAVRLSGAPQLEAPVVARPIVSDDDRAASKARRAAPGAVASPNENAAAKQTRTAPPGRRCGHHALKAETGRRGPRVRRSPPGAESDH
jgi:hypothetical protein